jgi:thiosulfate dehydrogenase (quinone) large subunit
MKYSLSPQTFTDRRMGFAILRLMLNGINMLGTQYCTAFEEIPRNSGICKRHGRRFCRYISIVPGICRLCTYVFGFVVVITETIIGVLLILGWKTRWALVTMGILLCSLAFGVILQQNFGTAANIMIYGIGVCLLLFHTEYDHFGIDRGFSFKQTSEN